MPRLSLASLDIAVTVANRFFFDSLPIHLSSLEVVFLGLPGVFPQIFLKYNELHF